MITEFPLVASLEHSDQWDDVMQVHPALAGVGYGSSVVAVLVGCYYNVIIAWCLYYLGSSFTVR
jgi:SNF family Na+-dependent transporter